MNFNPAELIIQIPVLLLALTAHEFAHGFIAYRLGDPTAKAAGRLTMNPLKHLDPLGTLAFIFIKFGWAKPVPVNPNYFRNPRQDMLKVALAGPATNMLLAVICAILVKTIVAFEPMLPSTQAVAAVLLPFKLCLVYSVWINLILCIFNFLPIPPLDGSRILMGLLPANMAAQYAKLERYSFVIILILLFSGVLSKIIMPIIYFMTNWLLG